MKAISDVKMNDIIQRLGKVKTVIQSNSAETNANYAGKPLTFSYTCTSELPTLTQDTALAFWKLRGGGVAEIQSFSLYSLNQFLKQHFIPKGNATVGMCQEFDSGSMAGDSYERKVNLSKLYTLNLTDGWTNYPIVIDDSHLLPIETNQTIRTTGFAIPMKDRWVTLYVSKTVDGSRIFSIDPVAGVPLSILRVCGYY